MRSGYELFSVGDVAVKIHGSFIFLGALMVLLALSAGGSGLDVGLRLLGPLILFGTVILHELGHAIVARKLNVRVIDVILTPLGGMARIAGELKDPKQEGLIAVAGPAMNLLLAGITFIVIAALGRTNEISLESIVFFLEDRRTFLRSDDLLIVFFGLNILLSFLNLIPCFPCDGGRVLRALLSARLGRLQGTRTSCKIGLYFALGLIVLPVFAPGQQWWITPFIGIYFIIATLKERLMVEAREGLGLSSGFFKFGQGVGADDQSPFQQPNQQESFDAAPQELMDENVIDVQGSSRIVDDPDER
ncbi:MAG: Zn-dependent protease [Planctomycetota bacterium]|jgi:Zn-dependent protease